MGIGDIAASFLRSSTGTIGDAMRRIEQQQMVDQQIQAKQVAAMQKQQAMQQFQDVLVNEQDPTQRQRMGLAYGIQAGLDMGDLSKALGGNAQRPRIAMMGDMPIGVIDTPDGGLQQIPIQGIRSPVPLAARVGAFGGGEPMYQPQQEQQFGQSQEPLAITQPQTQQVTPEQRIARIDAEIDAYSNAAIDPMTGKSDLQKAQLMIQRLEKQKEGIMRQADREIARSDKLTERQYQEQQKTADRQYDTTEKPLSGEASRLVASASDGIRAYEGANKLLVNNNGLNKNVIAELQSGLVVSQEARQLKNYLMRMVDARSRLTSGAALGEKELALQALLLLPSLLDEKETVDVKLGGFKDIFNDTLGQMKRNPKDMAKNIPDALPDDPAQMTNEQIMQLLGGQ